MTTQNMLDVGLSGATGTVSFVGSTSPTITNSTLLNPRISTVIDDSNGNIIIAFNPIASAVNYLQIQNAATTGAPSLVTAGSDTNIIFSLSGQGTGRAQIKGTGANDMVSTGYVGEFTSSVIPVASAVSLSTGTSANVTSISLTAGDWDVWGNIAYVVLGSCTALQGWISSTSATQPDLSLKNLLTSTTAVATSAFNVPGLRFSLSGTTTIYLSAEATFTTSTVTACGGIYARRRS